MSDSRIRRAGARDLDALCAIEARAHPRPWSREAFQRELDSPHCTVWLAVDADDAPLSYVVVWRVLDELQIQNVTTAEHARRRGLARTLLGHALSTAADAKLATLEVSAENSAAIALYASLGFDVVGRRRRYYSTGEDALLMNRAC